MLLDGKRILLIIGGGIAAYKALDLIRRLREAGARVRPVLTAGGAEFITPLSAAALAEDHCYTDLFSLKDEAEMGHIRLSREADLVLVAPATADLMAKMAHGHANDLASTVLLATDKPVLVAPSMNSFMWQHPATRRNLATLEADGIGVVAPGVGDLACGETGAGRLAEVADIVAAVARRLDVAAAPGLAPAAGASGPLAGRRVLVTAGPTHEPIDPVRYLANRSSGKQGFALAGALARAGAEVVLVAGPCALATPAGVTRVDVETARDMLSACREALPVDAAICVAAVADWRVAETGAHKLKKDATGGVPPALALTENPDILATLAQLETARPALVVGFAAETDRVLDHARAKRARKRCDWIVANDVSAATGIMGGDDTAVTVITDAGEDALPAGSKVAVAEALAARIAAALTPTPETTA
ncbi:bifunctional phosphopantothenoylcysteine decarboxylase/phosphopantothenate synthase [Rhodothalassium salexigens]|uniref:bifunctional phosphopantothenoylcysteine decarboxylase/phosphopantothenate--cysteine ligase CoaBC n=1 Tax=Rhodothalassium salexigens TaxID=1086 RepID=UPI0019133755|nr:bifunctional phosphopantothenoylcysteine decarboxylase/phosphopantothenate--cysteine ligase CoaBC [Rhodothalassium salexigens]MBK5921451.1 bifunctional phosphopantothenoylcysteine decarboxylase/phosphopantothenate synthase [Rhodothalassium salexigens]